MLILITKQRPFNAAINNAVFYFSLQISPNWSSKPKLILK